MGYTTTTEFRLITNLTTDDISDADVTSLITQATYQLNSDINIRVNREKVLPIDDTRENEIDGSNTTFYLRGEGREDNKSNWFGSASKTWYGKFIGDFDNDGDVGKNDITVYQVAADGTETELTVSSITPKLGKFVLSSAPSSGVRLYVTYCWCYEDQETPSNLIVLACTYLTAAMAFEKINRGLSPQQAFGNVRLTRDMKAGNYFYNMYRNMVDKINAGSSVTYKEAKVF